MVVLMTVGIVVGSAVVLGIDQHRVQFGTEDMFNGAIEQPSSSELELLYGLAGRTENEGADHPTRWTPTIATRPAGWLNRDGGDGSPGSGLFSRNSPALRPDPGYQFIRFRFTNLDRGLSGAVLADIRERRYLHRLTTFAPFPAVERRLLGQHAPHPVDGGWSVRVLPVGFIASAAIWGSVALAGVRLAKALSDHVRASVRSRAGKCKACGFVLNQNQHQCPECGAEALPSR